MLKEKSITMEELRSFLYEKREEIEDSMAEFWGSDYDCTFYHRAVEDIEKEKKENEEYCFGSSYEHGDFYTILYYFPTPENPEMDLYLEKNAVISQKEVYELFSLLLTEQG